MTPTLLMAVALWCEHPEPYESVWECKKLILECLIETKDSKECFKVVEEKPWPNFNHEEVM